jgi:hypothetical protein
MLKPSQSRAFYQNQAHTRSTLPHMAPRLPAKEAHSCLGGGRGFYLPLKNVVGLRAKRTHLQNNNKATKLVILIKSQPNV